MSGSRATASLSIVKEVPVGKTVPLSEADSLGYSSIERHCIMISDTWSTWSIVPWDLLRTA
ncbi:hypothetical protein CERZMDRAFT_91701 [Cercospora zeae-maydis SCOH1-5]|uniref:Uncharacterized protein n=1 Tax=Cercospora zeae-maydis SCOH1-5 TaxID=717836 RepID=A0A6A6F361_9PEZI|nr:hypothetical protein CERZMDRAFT_91701 [Cercospora zeae-maydis SCOH1-5]